MYNHHYLQWLFCSVRRNAVRSRDPSQYCMESELFFQQLPPHVLEQVLYDPTSVITVTVALFHVLYIVCSGRDMWAVHRHFFNRLFCDLVITLLIFVVIRSSLHAKKT
jgi:hypothetical protein